MSQYKPKTNEEMDQVKIYRATSRAYDILRENCNIRTCQLQYILKLWDTVSDKNCHSESNKKCYPEEVKYILNLCRPEMEQKDLDRLLVSRYKRSIKVDREYEHAVDRAKLHRRFDELLENGMSTDEQYRMVCNNESATSNCAGKLQRLDDRELYNILQKVFARFPKFNMSRDDLDPFLKPEFIRLGIYGRHPIHDKIAAEVAIPFLKKEGCLFAATEVGVVPGKNGFKPDALGYKNNEVWGVEVKRTMTDFNNGLNKDQYRTYMKYCNVVYILTDNQKVKKAATEWSEKETGGAVGVLYSKDFEVPHKILEAHNSKISEERRNQAVESVSTKFLENMVRCTVQENVNSTPEAMVKAIIKQLTSSTGQT